MPLLKKLVGKLLSAGSTTVHMPGRPAQSFGPGQLDLTHELTRTVADRVAILIDGRFAALGPRDEVLASGNPAVQAFLAGEARVTT